VKSKLITLFSLLAVLLALSRASPAAGERHPEIRAAIRALDAAKQDLEHAAHDFGGHRQEALEAIEHAHHQLEVCLQYNKD
jgi:hypothetical protein